MLKGICYLFVLSVIYTACTDASSTDTTNGADSIQKDSLAVKVVQDKNAYNEEEEIKKLIWETAHICDVAFTKDTIFIKGNDTFTVAFKHSCSGDSFLLPAKYIETYKMDRFMAYSLQSDIIVEKNGVGIVDRRIQKKDFSAVSDPVLNQYAVLQYPDLKITGDSVSINYSLSVPLTDVGIGVRATILKDGSIHFN